MSATAHLTPSTCAATDRRSQHRVSEETCIAALRTVASALRCARLSSPAYDAYRREHARYLPSSSVIRKRLGTWNEAMTEAGLEAPRRCTAVADHTRKTVQPVMLRWIRAAWWATDGELHNWRYDAWRDQLMERGHRVPYRSDDLARAFGSWSAALAVAGIRQLDEFHAQAENRPGDVSLMWTVGECRRLVRNHKARLGRWPTVTDWPDNPHALPNWDQLTELLPPGPWPFGHGAKL